MADPSTCPPLVPASVQSAHKLIKSFIHATPLITSRTLSAIASHENPADFLLPDPPPFITPSQQDTSLKRHTPPKINLYFKCENQQKIGAFKARGAFHAVTHLIESLGVEKVRERGVITHSSGNHAQALALAAHTFNIPSYIVMPSISTPSKIAGTRTYTSNVIFSGSTSDEREAKVEEVIGQTGAILVPPYDHPDIILGQGTAALEMEEQFRDLKQSPDAKFDVVLTPLGGGGLLSGTATWFNQKEVNRTLVFGTEPSFSGANDAEMGLAQHPPKRVEHVKSLTIADGLRTPVGIIPWSIISDTSKVAGVYSVSENEIKMAQRLMLERVKQFVEPSAAVPVAVVLFNENFRALMIELQDRNAASNGGKAQPLDIGIILSGGNTTVEAIAKLFGNEDIHTGRENNGVTKGQREVGRIGFDGSKHAEDIAG